VPVRVRPLDRPGRGNEHRQGHPRLHLCRVRGGNGRLGAVAGCRLQGADRIICVDLSEDRLALARGQGATDTWTGGADTVERVLE